MLLLAEAHRDPTAPRISDPFSHVVDSDHVEIFDTIDLTLSLGGQYKFMILQLLAAALILTGFLWLAKKVRTGETPKGRLWNLLESMLLFIRDDVARPTLGEHDYRRFLPYLWTTFFFILVLNMLGMVPFLASATASLAVTGVLALVAFVVIHYNGIKAAHGPAGYLMTFVPNIPRDDAVMKIIGPIITIGITALEILGAFIRGFVLAFRLFANMLAGHMVLFIILAFINLVGIKAIHAGSGSTPDLLFWPVTIGSVLMATALSLLELFVAMLQAFVFTFLTSVFIGLAIHPDH